MMTEEEFDTLLDSDYAVYSEYMNYIMEWNDGERVICNGDDLILLAEEGYLLDQFREYYIELSQRDWEGDAAQNDYERELV
jgi:hypothetical protein